MKYKLSIAALSSLLNISCSHTANDCFELRNDKALKEKYILGFGKSSTKLNAEKNAEKEIASFFSNYVSYSSKYHSKDGSQGYNSTSSMSMEKSIGSSGAYDISSTENLCMASEGESYGVLLGLSKKLVEKRISAQMKKANSWLSTALRKNKRNGYVRDIDLLRYSIFEEEERNDENVWLSLDLDERKFPKLSRFKKREFEKQYLSKKSQPIYIYTTDDYSKETLDVVLEKFKPYGVKPQMTTSSAKADFIWSCKISTGRASSSYTSYRGSCNFNGEVKLVEEFELSGLAHNDKIDDYIILKINQNLRTNSAH